jgi:NAD(P)-dependent dehydrogenase (short-subunit alcohol dehydrogenase family)
MSRAAIVTGASRGIGRAVADALVAGGWHVVAAVRAPSDGTPRYDARDPAAASAIVAHALDTFGRLDALVCSAGILRPCTASTGDDAALAELLDVNLHGPLRLARAAWPHLLASGHGRIVNVASLSGKRVANDYAGYAISKAALIAATHALRREGFAAGIRATALCPSFVATDMSAGMGGPPPETMTQPADLARLIATLLDLPGTASVAELVVHCRFEGIY